MENPYIVYVKIDSSGRIVAINSSEFLSDLTDWIKIDEGYGDQYHHAQGNYFDRPIVDDNGIYRYKLVDGVPVERTREEMDADITPDPEPTPTLESRVETLETDAAEMSEALEMILAGVTE